MSTKSTKVLQVRVSPAFHRKLKLYAVFNGMSLGEAVERLAERELAELPDMPGAASDEERKER